MVRLSTCRFRRIQFIALSMAVEVNLSSHFIYKVTCFALTMQGIALTYAILYLDISVFCLAIGGRRLELQLYSIGCIAFARKRVGIMERCFFYDIRTQGCLQVPPSHIQDKVD